MTQHDLRKSIQRSDLYPDRIFIASVATHLDEVAAEIVAERDAELVKLVVAKWAESDPNYSQSRARIVIRAIRAAGFSITKDGATS